MILTVAKHTSGHWGLWHKPQNKRQPAVVQYRRLDEPHSQFVPALFKTREAAYAALADKDAGKVEVRA